MIIATPTPYSIKFESILVEADRFDTKYEIVKNVVEVNIFENIDLPYLTATILIADSSNLLNMIDFQGTEKFTIKVKIDGDDSSKIVEKHFIVTDIGGVAPANDHSEAITLNLIEDFAYQSRLITVSKAYSGKPEDIIESILTDNLQKSVKFPTNFQGTTSRPMKVIVPSINPLDAVRWIKNRLVSENGMPFFVYSTLNGPDLFFKDLETILRSDIMNEKRPYSFGQAFTRYTGGDNVSEQARVIENYRLTRSENMYKLAQMGTLNSTYYFVDTTKYGSVVDTSIQVNMEDIIKDMKDKGILSNDQSRPIYDDKFTIGDKTIAEYNPSLYTQIVSSNTFNDYANYYEDDDITQQKLRMYSRALRYYLLKSPLDIVMPGFDFLGRGDDITIGRQIRLNFLKNDPDISEKFEDSLDKKRSGEYIIYACRHIMRPEKYSVSMTCTKLGNLA